MVNYDISIMCKITQMENGTLFITKESFKKSCFKCVYTEVTFIKNMIF